jgi:hypothetical protein
VRAYRYIALSALMTFGIFSAVVYSSCSKTKCGSVVCQNGSVCESNVCVCPTGYSGSDCGTSWSTEFLGAYTCTQSCSPTAGPTGFTSTIATYPNSGQDSVTISNFGGYNINLVAGVDANNKIYIQPSATSSVSATGTYDPTTKVMVMKYSISLGGSSSESCTMTMTKQ